MADVTGRNLEETLIRDTSERIADLRTSKEGQEGLRAFLEKRRPAWQTETL